MNLTSATVLILLSIAWRGAGGSTYSKVYVQSGIDTVPVNYVKYGAPGVPISTPQLAQLSAAPIGSVVPLPPMSTLVSPCVSPCVVPGQSIAPFAQIPAASAKIVTAPVVVAPSSDDKASYEYSYVVYDENTGDQKSQRELSDGSVVRGQYSLIQPDGYVRQVQYTADDLKGFNAVVKSFLPTPSAPEPKNPDKKESKPDKKPNKKEDIKKKEQKSGSLVTPPKNKLEPRLKQQTVGKALGELEQEYYPEKAFTNTINDGEKALKTSTTPKPASKITPKPKTPLANTPDTEAVVSYNDIIRCIQAAIQKSRGSGAPIPTNSALTYIVLPSSGTRPC